MSGASFLLSSFCYLDHELAKRAQLLAGFCSTRRNSGLWGLLAAGLGGVVVL